jgi:TPR repeat protein
MYRKNWKLWGTLILVLTLLAAAETPAAAQVLEALPPSGSTCELLKTCEVECDGGNHASCARAAEQYREGRGVVANRERAAEIYKRSCDDAEHPRSCMEYAWMVRDGWMFEVERDASAFRDYALTKTRVYGEAACDAGNLDACFTLADNEKRIMDRDDWDDPLSIDEGAREEIERVASDIISRSRKACRAGHVAACEWMLGGIGDVQRRGYLGATLSEETIEKEVNAGFETSCALGDSRGCTVHAMTVMGDASNPALVAKGIQLLEKPCEQKNGEACLILSVLTLFATDSENVTDPEQAREKLISQLNAIANSCAHADGPLAETVCQSIVVKVSQPKAGGSGPKQVIAMHAKRCAYGIVSSCEVLLETATDEDFLKRPSSPQLASANAKICELSPYGTKCNLCSQKITEGASARNSKHQLCRTRLAWKERLGCDAGKEDHCEILASMYQSGDGVTKSTEDSIGYYRLACDSALKSSCSTLESLCRTSKALDGDERCMQSLIHSDVFYEAEWQFRQTGSAKILGKVSPSTDAIGSVSVRNQVSSGPGLSLKRGSLNADLVVSVVLDRARQAAIRLVVSELKRAGRRASIPVYLEDLLTQASLLLSDQSSMRREKFQDLGMTVVRAFVASNLTKTIFATNDSFLEHKAWQHWATEEKLGWTPEKFGKEDLVKLREYLTDWVYYTLAETPLFGRAAEGSTHIPACPFKSKSTKVVCALLSDNRKPNVKRLATLLRVQDMLQGLGLAKALREEGSIDLRRFIEAIGRSHTVANLKSTPGLNIQQWKKEIADNTETRLRDLRIQLKASKSAFTSAGWKRMGSAKDVRKMRENALRLVSEHSPYRALFDAENVQKARGILNLAKNLETRFGKLETIEAQIDAAKGFSLGGGPNAETLATSRIDAQRELSQAGLVLRRAIKKWDDAEALLAKLSKLRADLDETRPLILEFRRSLVEIETMVRRYKPPRVPGADITIEVASQFDISHVPLHALPDLRVHFQNVATTLVHLDKQLGEVFPGRTRSKLKFTVSAVVRLLGFFDLMERVARTARLNQTCGDVIGALRLLGSVGNNEFRAPLFDVMAPVLQAIKTHEPMDVDQLFTVISKVRLDSLITSLATDGVKPCEGNEKGFECWTVKIIHALQEAVQRDGESIKIDGGAFAKRLASHGDDFRRRHKWRSYFHLTVGFGGLASTPYQTNEMESTSRRVVPLIGEQIGFGWASPTFWNDALTFKVGAYGTGILYRATLDSEESNAIMASPFVALDFYDLIELYAGPMVLFYPPQDDQGAAVRLGASVGLTVPLSAYLEKL